MPGNGELMRHRHPFVRQFATHGAFHNLFHNTLDDLWRTWNPNCGNLLIALGPSTRIHGLATLAVVTINRHCFQAQLPGFHVGIHHVFHACLFRHVDSL